MPEMADAVRAFLTAHPLTVAGTGDLLALVRLGASTNKYVASTRNLPMTARALWAENRVHGSISERNELGIDPDASMAEELQVDMLTVANGHIEQPFAHYSLARVIADLLLEDFAFVERFNGQIDEDGVRTYGEMWTGDWWKKSIENISQFQVPAQPQTEFPTAANILSIIIYVDGVSLDFFGNVHAIPIMLTFGNYSRQDRQCLRSKRLLGFVPHISDKDIPLQCRESASAVRRYLLHATFTV